MTDWQQLAATDYQVPAEMAIRELIDDLAEALRSPDPTLRDMQAYSTAARLVMRGRLDSELEYFGDLMAGRYRDPEIQARTFAPLIHAVAIARDRQESLLSREVVHRWRDTFADWYVGEQDLRGWDDKLGWLHAVAHGADFIDELGMSRHSEARDLVALLELASARLIVNVPDVFRDAEDDRLAVAFAHLLLRDELSAEQAVAWLRPIADVLENRDPAKVQAVVSNSVRTLRALYLLVDRGIRDYADGAWTEPSVPAHRTHILDHLADVLRITEPHTG